MVMSFEIRLTNKATKCLEQLKRNKIIHTKILRFLDQKLATTDNPTTLPNARKLVGFDDNRYRWRLGDYRIIGTIQNGKLKIIEILEITKRDDTTYSHTR